MALNFDTAKLSPAVQRILAKAEAREGKPLVELLAQRSINDVIRQAVFPALDRAITNGEIPDEIADLVEGLE